MKEKKTWKGKKGSEKGPARDFTRGTLMNAIKSNTSIRATAHSGAGYKFDDEEQKIMAQVSDKITDKSSNGNKMWLDGQL